ncbi:MAG: hypothetical protein AAFY82_07690 [Pseudomonadota bacterium]
MMKPLLSISMAALIVSAPALAQDLRASSEKVVACQNVADSLERLACFEAAAMELSTVLTAPIAAVAPEATPAPVPQPSAVADAAPSAGVEAPVLAETPSAPAPVPVATDAPVQQAAATATEAPIERGSLLPSWMPRLRLGGDDAEADPDEFQTTMTRIQRNKIGRHFFTTEEGYVWRQLQIEPIRAPSSLPAEVILYQNVMGGIRLKIVETNRSYSVIQAD